MSSMFTPDFAAVEAGFPMYDRGLYRVKVSGIKPFVRESKPDESGTTKVLAGIDFKLEMHGAFDDEGDIDTAKQGKAVSKNTVWMHSEGGWQFAKPFIMAVAGFKKNQENEANEELFQGGDWTFPEEEPGVASEAIELGASWEELVDRFVDVQMRVEKTIDEAGNVTFEEQVFSAWHPVEV